jgi:hypothetical protein
MRVVFFIQILAVVVFEGCKSEPKELSKSEKAKLQVMYGNYKKNLDPNAEEAKEILNFNRDLVIAAMIEIGCSDNKKEGYSVEEQDTHCLGTAEKLYGDLRIISVSKQSAN